jgi:hypothetical protein
MHVNAIFGQGAGELTTLLLQAPETETLDGGIITP